jgi:hypothetical protein
MEIVEKIIMTERKSTKISEELISLHRHYIWADFFKKNYHTNISNKNFERIKDKIKQNPGLYYIEPTGILMCYWYSSLFTVLEGIKSMKIIISNIHKETIELYEPLRRFRNATYHHKKKYWDKRFFEIWKKDGYIQKIEKLHNEIGNYFLNKFDKTENNYGQFRSFVPRNKQTIRQNLQ